VHVLREGKHADRVELSGEDWLRLVTWIDGNAPYHDGFINKRIEPPPYDLTTDGELESGIAAVHERRCSSCHVTSVVTRLDWIDLRSPAKSLFLWGPLSAESGGAGRCAQVVYRDPSDPDYSQVLRAVEKAVEKAWSRPRRDLRALVEPGGAEAGGRIGMLDPLPDS
jgi:hypothetical protein